MSIKVTEEKTAANAWDQQNGTVGVDTNIVIVLGVNRPLPVLCMNS